MSLSKPGLNTALGFKSSRTDLLVEFGLFFFGYFGGNQFFAERIHELEHFCTLMKFGETLLLFGFDEEIVRIKPGWVFIRGIITFVS